MIAHFERQTATSYNTKSRHSQSNGTHVKRDNIIITVGSNHCRRVIIIIIIIVVCTVGIRYHGSAVRRRASPSRRRGRRRATTKHRDNIIPARRPDKIASSVPRHGSRDRSRGSPAMKRGTCEKLVMGRYSCIRSNVTSTLVERVGTSTFVRLTSFLRYTRYTVTNSAMVPKYYISQIVLIRIGRIVGFLPKIDCFEIASPSRGKNDFLSIDKKCLK